MKKFDKYMIVSDMDGTFFGEKAAILDNNLKAIEYFRENGGVFTFASGRDYVVLGHQYPELSKIVSCPAVLCNGSYLYDFEKKERYFELGLDRDELASVVAQIEAVVPEATYRISCERGFICPPDKAIPFPANRIDFFEKILVRDHFSNHKDIVWHKLVFSSNGMKGASSDGLSDVQGNFIPKIEKFLETIDLKTIEVTTSSPTLLELMPKGASKGQALKKLKELYPDRLVICVGDYCNDLDMLKAADIPACPENALDEVKDICKIHLCHHREGCIADLIYKLDSSTKE